jgi:hypothetical protein
MTRRFLLLLPPMLVVSLLPAAVRSQETNAVRLANLRRVAEWSAAGERLAGGKPHLLARRGLLADRERRRVELLAEASGLGAYAAIEFGLVGELSDRGYEALAFSFARATDLAEALEFIGLPRGLNVKPKEHRFWPKGERVFIEVQVLTNEAAPPLPIESFVLDRRTEQPLARQGMIYCGSARRPAEAGGDCLADHEPPMSLLSTYNEPQTVLDVPRPAPQGDVYESFVMHPDRKRPEGELLRFVFTPEPRPGGVPRVLAVALTALPAADGQGAAFDCSLDGEPARRLDDTGALIRLMKSQVEAGRDPYVTLAIDDALPLAHVRDLCAALRLIEGENGVRMEPPPPGNIYYKAFLPDEKWRDRATRLSQPWELHVGRPPAAGAPPPLTLVQILEDWSDPASLDPKLTVREHPLKDHAELPAKIRELGGGPPVLLVYAPLDAPVGIFMPAVRLVRETQPLVHVFGEP